MKQDFEEIGACPHCAGNLLWLENEVICKVGSHRFKVVNGVPRFTETENYAESFGFQWNLHSATQLDRFSGVPISHDRFFRETGWPADELRDRTVLEVGSGAGRFTQVICEAGARVFSIDYSRAVDANRSNNGEFSNLFLAQASIYEAPFKPSTFDYVVCLGVLQHTPSPAETVGALINLLRPGGKFCIDAYASPMSYFHPRHLLRIFTKRMDKKRLYEMVCKWVPRLLPLSTGCHRIPLIGQYLARLIPVANWRHNVKLPTEAMYMEWAILDTFDWLSPAYEYPQSRRSLRRALSAANVSDFTITRERGLYIVRGQKKPNVDPSSI